MGTAASRSPRHLIGWSDTVGDWRGGFAVFAEASDALWQPRPKAHVGERVRTAFRGVGVQTMRVAPMALISALLALPSPKAIAVEQASGGLAAAPGRAAMMVASPATGA